MRNAFLVASLFVAGLIEPVHATFHFMQIEQVLGGVDGDTSAQAIQLRMRSFGQNIVSEGRLVVFDAAGTNPVIILDLTSNVSQGSTGDRVLIVSSNFVNTTGPMTEPDFLLTTLIPPDYLVAGRLTWEDDFGTILWSVSWGGTNYSGSNAGAFDNDNDGNFGPPFAAPLPSTGAEALLFTNSANRISHANATDYVVTSGAAVFHNNARDSFTVGDTNVPPEIHDFAVLKLKAPKKVTLKEDAPPKPGKIAVSIQNLGPTAEVISNATVLAQLVQLNVESLGDCPAPLPTLVAPTTFPLTLLPNKKLNLSYTVTIDCANDPLSGIGREDYRTTVMIDRTALDGLPDTNPANDDCPRPASGTDKGCGNKDPVTKQIGADVLTDVIEK